jgi:hypothetical protein
MFLPQAKHKRGSALETNQDLRLASGSRFQAYQAFAVELMEVDRRRMP